MKKLALLIAVVCLCACGATAQARSEGSPMPVCQPGHNCPDQARQAANEGVQIGPNTVCVDHIRNGVVLSHYCSHNLKTTWGIDWIAGFLGAGSGFNYASPTVIDLSTDSASPAAGDCVTAPCTLAGLITTNGLAPNTGVYAHTTGTNTYTLTKTFTATGTLTNVQKAALSSYVLGGACSSSSCGFAFENTFTPVTLAANDQLQITWTITIS